MKKSAVFLLLSIFVIAGCGEYPRKKVVGLQLHSFRESMRLDAHATLKKVANIGYSTVETAGYENGRLYGYTPEKFRNICDELGLKILSAHVIKPYDSSKEAEFLAWWDLALEVQLKAGCKYVITSNIPSENGVDTTFKITAKNIKLFCNYLNRIGALANEKGLKFGFHNHENEFYTLGEETIFDYIVENTDPEKVFFQLDVYGARKRGVDPVECIKKYNKRIKMLHIKDQTTLGESKTVDFVSIFKTAYSFGINEYFVEVERYGTSLPEDCIKRSFEFVEGIDLDL